MPDYVRQPDAFIKRSRQVLHPQALPHEADDQQVREAAILVPVVARGSGLTVLLTQRSDDLPSHAGQVAFPGGKIDAADQSALDAALRETEEETGIARHFVTPVGYLDTFSTGSGFSIVPVVGVVETGFILRPEPDEVSDIFEVPLAFLMDRANHTAKQAEWRGKRRHYYEMPYEGRYIWGVTAHILRELSARLHGLAREAGK